MVFMNLYNTNLQFYLFGLDLEFSHLAPQSQGPPQELKLSNSIRCEHIYFGIYLLLH